jgi:hypothetical protein
MQARRQRNQSVPLNAASRFYRRARCRSNRANACSTGITPQGFILILSPEPDRQLQNQYFKIAIMGQAERPTCPDCGAFLILALPLGGKGPRKLRCLDCDRPDPLKSEYVAGWLEGELQPPTKSSQ